MKLGLFRSIIDFGAANQSLPRRGPREPAAGHYLLRKWREAFLEKDGALQTFVRDGLMEGWRISRWLKAGKERRPRSLDCETLYGFIYRASQKSEELWRYLTPGGPLCGT